jgi:hypothetical protein
MPLGRVEIIIFEGELAECLEIPPAVDLISRTHGSW